MTKRKDTDPQKNPQAKKQQTWRNTPGVLSQALSSKHVFIHIDDVYDFATSEKEYMDVVLQILAKDQSLEGIEINTGDRLYTTDRTKYTEAIKGIAQFLIKNQCIWYLAIVSHPRNGFNDDEIDSIFEALQNNKSITSLRLENFSISDKQFKKLMLALQNNKINFLSFTYDHD